MLKRKVMPLFLGLMAFLMAGNLMTVLATDTFCSGYDGSTNDPRINTAIGCIPVTISGFIGWFLPKLFGIIGGVSFLLMIYGFILIATSQGDPKKVQGAKETITSAITGLLVSIFSLFILRLIAVNILHIPGIN